MTSQPRGPELETKQKRPSHDPTTTEEETSSLVETQPVVATPLRLSQLVGIILKLFIYMHLPKCIIVVYFIKPELFSNCHLLPFVLDLGFSGTVYRNKMLYLNILKW